MTGVPFAVRFGLDATNNRVVNVANPPEWNDPSGEKDAAPRDWILQRSNWTKLAGRAGDLPLSTASSPLRDGETYLIKYDFGGEKLSRLAVWDSTQTQTGGVLTIKVVVPPSEVANVQAEAALGSDWPGEPFIGGNGDCIFDLTPNSDGTMTATVTTAGSGYHFGEAFSSRGYGSITSVGIEVAALSGASSTGGWRYTNVENWVKNTRTNADVQTDAGEGDFQATAENLHKELKVFHNGAWVTLFSEDDIKAWIASLSLFEGTVKEEGGGAIGAVEFDGLPNLDEESRLTNLGQVSHYWTFVGAPNTPINAEYDVTGLTAGVPGTYRVTIGGSIFVARVLTPTTAKVGVVALDPAVVNGNNEMFLAGDLGTGSSAASFTIPDITKPATPIIGTDLSGALLNPGDWVQISNRGTAAAPDLRWVTIGGDLLAKARADKLFGLAQWVDGGWEKGSLVTDQGTIYRAKQAIVSGDIRPGTGAPVEQIDTLTITAPTAAGQAYTVDVNGNVATYSSVAGNTAEDVRDGLIAAVIAATPVALIVTPSKGTQPDQLLLTANAPGTPFVATATTTNFTVATTQANVVGAVNPWEKVKLSGGVRWVQADGDLPAKAPAGEIYFVLASAKAGGTGRLTYWDGGANKWQDLGGSGAGGALDLTGGTVIYPDELYWDGATGTKPVGRVVGDLLYTGKTNTVERWDGTAWNAILRNVPFGDAANEGKFMLLNASGNPTLSNGTFIKEARAAAGPRLFTKWIPAGSEEVVIDIGDSDWKIVRMCGALELQGVGTHLYFNGFDKDGNLATPQSELVQLYAYLQYGNRLADSIEKQFFFFDNKMSLTWKGSAFSSSDGISATAAHYPWLDLTITKMYDDYMQIRWELTYYSYGGSLYKLQAVSEWKGSSSRANMQTIRLYGQRAGYRLGAQLQITRC